MPGSRRFRRLTRRLRYVLITIAALAVAGAGWVFFIKPDPARVAAGHLDRAEAFVRDNKIDAAVIEYKNALQLQPDDGATRTKLARLYMQLRQPAPAIKEIEKAEQAGVRSAESTRLLIEALIATGEHDRALGQVATARAAGDDTVALRTLEARAQLAKGDIDNARAALEQASGEHPDDLGVLIGLASVSFSARDYPTALAKINEALATSPTSVDALILRGQVYGAQNELALSQADYESALKVESEHLAAKLGLVEVLLKQKKLAEAKPLVADLEAALQANPMTQYLRGVIAFLENDKTAAREFLTGVLNAVPDHAQSLLLMGEIAFEAEQYQQALDYLEALHKRYRGHLPSVKRMAVAHLKLGRHQRALELLAPYAEGAAKDPGYWVLLSHARRAAGDAAGSKDALAKAQALAPDAPFVRAQQAVSTLATGDLDAAITELKQLSAGESSSVHSDLLLVYAYLQKNDHKTALQMAEAAAARYPDNALPQNLIGAVRLATRDLPGARQAFEAALKLEPGFVPALQNLGQLDIASGDLKSARARYEAAIKSKPDYAPGYVALADLAFRENNEAEGVRLLEQAAQLPTQSVEARMALAQYRARRAEYDEAVRLLREAVAISPRAPQVQFALARTLLAGGKAEESLQLLESLHKDYPKVRDVDLERVRANLAVGKLDVAREAATALRAADAKDPAGLLALLDVELRAGRIDAALALVGEFEQTHPEDVRGGLARAATMLAAKRYLDAAQAFAGVHAKAPTSGTLVQYANALVAGGDVAGARAAYGKWLGEHPDDQGIRLALAGVEEAAGNSAAAQKLYEDIIAAQPTNAVALNNLAYLLLLRGDARAIDYAERAYLAAPQSPAIADTLGWILVRNEKVERGLKLLKSALDRLPRDPNVRYHHAAALARSGDKAAARAALDALLAEVKQFSERAEAEALLKDLAAQG